eukprot:Skav226614  [mRNA]  locus=scaffold2041:206570:208816:- [translate_table: standard]
MPPPRQSFLITRNAVLAACSRRSLWQPAVKLLEDFCRESMQVDVVTYNNALSACVKSKQWQQSLQLFEDAQWIRALLMTCQCLRERGAMADGAAAHEQQLGAKIRGGPDSLGPVVKLWQ